MTAQDLTQRWIELPDLEAQRRFLETHAPLLDDDVARAIKQRADQLLRADVQRCLQVARLLIGLAWPAGKPLCRALGLLAEANARSIGLGEYQRALELYDEAAEIYQACGCVVERARAQIGKVWPLACLGHYTQAVESGEWASEVLEAHAEWRALADMTMNLAAIHGRQGEDSNALALLDRALELHRQLGGDRQPILPLIEQNRAIVLRNLGRFEASIAASQKARLALTELGQTVEAARAQQNLANTYFVLGRYNEALKLLNEARDVFVADGRQRDAILVQLFMSDCLLQLRRFGDVLDKCRQVRELFTGLGVRFEVGQTILNEAAAYAGLGRYEEALASLIEARRRFAREDNEVWVAATDLERATILLRQAKFDESRDAIQACLRVFREHGLPLKEAQSQLVAARVAANMNQEGHAVQLVDQALRVGQSRGIPALTYQCHHLLGGILQGQGAPQAALAEYERAIQDLEQLRGRLMVEYRAEFSEDKHSVHEDAVCLCLKLNQPHKGLEYAERAKSRALLDLLVYRLDLSVQARSKQDVPLVQQLMRLRAERDRLYRRWEAREDIRTRGGEQQVQQDVLALEKQITSLWHELLIRNADYARDAALWQVRTEPVQPYLDDDTLLLEYFFAHRKLVVFQVTGEDIQAQYLPGDLNRVQHLLRLLWLNLKTVPRCRAGGIPGLAKNARGLLQRLYGLLLAPLAEELRPYRRLIIVPHGPLHYLPFHALHDGQAFLLERHEISYLPGASLLRYCCEAQPATSGLTAFGYSCAGRLPYAIQEARSIAQLMGGQAILEQEATSERLREASEGCRVLHLATHGDFRPDNPLFSGLALAGGWLTTLDIFGLHLDASLVTLSACQTGRNVVKGGDELMGLTRAFLYAGATSLALSLWPVEDSATAQLMATFYRKLADGWTKVTALRHAQLELIERQRQGDAAAQRLAHPYFWAPFFLVGDPGYL